VIPENPTPPENPVDRIQSNLLELTQLTNPDISRITDFRNKVHAEIGKVVVGQTSLIDDLLNCILSNGHTLLEGVPGVAKTLIAKSLASLIGAKFTRIQFTPDLMPSDIVGTKIFDFSDSTFKTQKGPVFSNLVLIDEVNRAPAKTQAALLEVMEERQVTIEGETFPMEYPFLVLATQNPVEFEGTYQLPEAQLDRFLMKILVAYPEEEEEKEVLRRFHSGVLKIGESKSGGNAPGVLAGATELKAMRRTIESVAVEDGIFGYINRLVRGTRNHGHLFMGSSPRGNIALLLCAKTRAALSGRDYVNPDDVKSTALPVLRHRVILNPEAEIEGLTVDQILRSIADQAEVPR